MAEIPEGTFSRTARLAGLPIAAAGRITLGLGQWLAGRDTGEITTDLQRRTAEQLFEVLGTLKGGAMKFGQALSVLEAGIPEEYAAPYREALTRLQNAAPPMPTTTVHYCLTQQFGSEWNRYFREFDDTAAAAASIGQVHRATWRDGRTVAVKLQYPGAGAALRTDLNQLARLAPLLGVLIPGVEIRPLIAELKDRVMEELDYRIEAENQRRFAAAFADDPQILIPKVVASAPKAMVTEWVEGTDLSAIIRAGTQEERDRAGRLLTEFHFSSPQRARALHADPHPGNFQLAPDGRLIVIDFGSVAQLPQGAPPIIGRLSRLALAGDADAVLAELRREGFISDRYDPDPEQLIASVVPFVEPLRTETFHFTREWMRGQAAKMVDLSSSQSRLARHMNLPPSYLLIERVTFGSLGVLCQLDCTAPFREIVRRWQPGFADDTE